MADGSLASARIVKCGHPDYAGVNIDFSEFAKGAPDINASAGRYKWNGGFRGRPELIDALMPEIQTRYSRKPPAQIVSVQGNLRALWRFLDTWEDQFGGAGINRLLDIGDVHGVAWMRQNPPPRRDPYQLALRLLNSARARIEVNPLYWEVVQSEPPQVIEAPDPQQIKILYHELKHRAFAIYARWAHADACAVRGKSLIGVKRIGCKAPPITEDDAHATYRAIIAITGNPAPNAKQVGEVLGLTFLKTMPRHWPSVASLQAGLYPTREDVQILFHLFLIQCGWNPQTALDLDISNDRWAVDHTSGPHIKIVESYKNRSASSQFCLSLVKPSTSPYRIVTALIERTRGLRIALSNERCLSPMVAARSPWLYVGSRDSIKAISVLDAKFGSGTENTRFLKLVARRHNEASLQLHQQRREHGDVASEMPTLLSENIKATDLRDAYIGLIYLRSGYNWLLAMFAAGHKSLRSLRHYLNHRSYRAHGEARVSTFQSHLWQEIERHRIVDPAILHTLCQQGEISQEQRDRWLAKKDRTYVGMGCRDFYHPPQDIEPDHVDGHGCRTQRCSLCRHGILFPDSMPYLARRLAELHWLREQIPLPTWLQSGFPDELESLELSLENFPRDDVESQRLLWRSQIENGRHVPLSFRGAHG